MDRYRRTLEPDLHAYFEIELTVVWNIVNDDIPAWIRQLEQIASPEGE